MKNRSYKWIVLLSLGLLVACAGRPEGVLEPVSGTVPGATLVPILVATTRAPSDSRGQLYSGERGTAIDLKEIVVSIPPDAGRKAGEVQWPKKLPPDPSKEFATVSVTSMADADAAKTWFRSYLGTNGRLLLYGTLSDQPISLLGRVESRQAEQVLL